MAATRAVDYRNSRRQNNIKPWIHRTSAVVNSKLKAWEVIQVGVGAVQVGDRDIMAYALQMVTIFSQEIHSLLK
jgi:hypothetical protein